MAKSNEPIWWLPFFLGAGVAGMFVPALLFITGIVLPLAQAERLPPLRPVSYERLAGMIEWLPVQLFLFVVVSLSFFHFAHRARYTAIDLGLHGARQLMAVLCYGSAILGTGLSAWVIWG